MGSVAKAVGLGGSSSVGSGGKFAMSPEAVAAENEMISRLRGQAAGTSPSVTGMQYQQSMGDIAKQQQSAAASSRGVSNAGLLSRQAMMGGQQAGVELAGQAAISKLQEQRSADEQLQRIAANQRGVAFQSGLANQQGQEAQQQRMSSFLGSLGGTAAKVAGAAYGAEVPGEPVVEGDSPVNDTKDYKLSPGEIVIPRSAAQDRESAMAFLDALKFDKEKNKAPKEDKELKEPAKEQETDFHAMAKGMAALLQSMADQHKKK
jgi:hypothetical protein